MVFVIILFCSVHKLDHCLTIFNRLVLTQIFTFKIKSKAVNQEGDLRVCTNVLYDDHLTTSLEAIV